MDRGLGAPASAQHLGAGLASPSSRFSTGAGTQQSQSIEPGTIKQSQFSSSFIGAGTQQSQSIEAGTQQPQFIEAGTQQPQFITPTAQDGRRDSSFIGAGTKQPQFITPTAQQDGRRYSSKTALPGVPGGREHSTTALPGVPGGREYSTTALPGVPGGPEHLTRKILLQYHDVMLTGRDGTKTVGPFAADTVLDMVDNRAINNDSSPLASPAHCPPGFAVPFWEPFASDKGFQLCQAAQNQACFEP